MLIVGTRFFILDHFTWNNFASCQSHNKTYNPSPISGETLIKYTHASFSPIHLYTRTFVGLRVDLPSFRPINPNKTQIWVKKPLKKSPNLSSPPNSVLNQIQTQTSPLSILLPRFRQATTNYYHKYQTISLLSMTFPFFSVSLAVQFLHHLSRFSAHSQSQISQQIHLSFFSQFRPLSRPISPLEHSRAWFSQWRVSTTNNTTIK